MTRMLALALAGLSAFANAQQPGVSAGGQHDEDESGKQMIPETQCHDPDSSLRSTGSRQVVADGLPASPDPGGEPGVRR